MEFYFFGAPVPNAIGLGVGGAVAATIGSVTALVPLAVAVASVLRARLRAARETRVAPARVPGRLTESPV